MTGDVPVKLMAPLMEAVPVALAATAGAPATGPDGTGRLAVGRVGLSSFLAQPNVKGTMTVIAATSLSAFGMLGTCFSSFVFVTPSDAARSSWHGPTNVSPGPSLRMFKGQYAASTGQAWADPPTGMDQARHREPLAGGGSADL